MKNPTFSTAVAYARYSSSMQRGESIKAQIRAIETYADENGFILLDSYVDEAQSGTTDNRISFQQLIADIKSKRIEVDAVIVHKLDRFARNRYDAAIYRDILNKHNVKLISVTENFQDTPESVILQSVIEGMNEYYSLNLCREVRKGLKENALSAAHTGGKPPLGYDVDPATKKLVINESESQAVKMIFTMYLEGCGYTEIINQLNANGYKTKRGQSFGKNSINAILHNIKYTGLYTYNLVSPKYDKSGKAKRFAKAEGDNLIQIPGAVPQIISQELFDAVQQKLKERKHKAGRYNAKENYLLSGKIFCGECGAPYTGNKRKARSDHPEYISYRCSKRNGKNKSCHNTEVRKDYVEDLVLKSLSNIIFDDSMICKIYGEINKFILEKTDDGVQQKNNVEKNLRNIKKQIDNLVSVIANTGSQAVLDKLEELEKEKIVLESQLNKIISALNREQVSKDDLKNLFFKAKKLFENGTLEASKKLIDLFVERVDVYTDRIELKLNILPPNTPIKAHLDKDGPSELFMISNIRKERELK